MKRYSFMPDPFATFSLSPRPWLDTADLQARFHALAAKHHPDTLKGNSQTDDRTVTGDNAFQAINEAHRTLQDPVTRLQHLLYHEAPEELDALRNVNVSMDMSDHFMEVATILREVQAFTEQQTHSRSPLARAVLKAEYMTLRRDLDRALARMDELWRQCEHQIQAADTVWDRRNPGILRQLATVQREMAFLQKWRTQLREARLQMNE